MGGRIAERPLLLRRGLEFESGSGLGLGLKVRVRVRVRVKVRVRVRIRLRLRLRLRVRVRLRVGDRRAEGGLLLRAHLDERSLGQLAPRLSSKQ